MERASATGLSGVAELLRRMADGIEEGEVEIAGESFLVDDGLVATVEAPVAPAGSMVVAMRFEWPHRHAAHLAVEQELTRPGG